MPAEPPADRLLTLDQVADRLACSAVKVRRLCQTGQLASVKHGRHRRVLESALARYISALPNSPASAPAEGNPR